MPPPFLDVFRCFLYLSVYFPYIFATAQLARDALLVHGPLAHRLGVHQLRNDLESAAFRRLFPEKFNEVGTFAEMLKQSLLRDCEAGGHVAAYLTVVPLDVIVGLPTHGCVLFRLFSA